MINENILCCINDCPLFSYHSLGEEKDFIKKQNIINFVTQHPSSRHWITKETTFEGNVEIYYYEINVEKAFQYLKAQKKISGKSIERFCLTFLNFFLQETSSPLIEFLRRTKTYTESELKSFESLFQKENLFDASNKSIV